MNRNVIQLFETCQIPYAEIEEVADLVARSQTDVNQLRNRMGLHVIMHAITGRNLPVVKYFYSIGVEYQDEHLIWAAQILADDVFIWLVKNKLTHPLTERHHAFLVETRDRITQLESTAIYFEMVLVIEQAIGNTGRGLESPDTVWMTISSIDYCIESHVSTRHLETLDRAIQYAGLPMLDILERMRVSYPLFPRTRRVLLMFLAGGARAGLEHVRADEMHSECLDEWDQQRNPLQILTNAVGPAIGDHTNPYIAADMIKYLVSDPE